MAKIRVLVVDDEPAILRFLKPALEANNYVLMSAGTVAEAVKRIAADTPDIVVLDLGLPGRRWQGRDPAGADMVRRADHRAVGAGPRGRESRSAGSWQR